MFWKWLLNNEIVQGDIVGLMPKWKTEELADGTKVAVKYTIPVMFKLQ